MHEKPGLGAEAMRARPPRGSVDGGDGARGVMNLPLRGYQPNERVRGETPGHTKLLNPPDGDTRRRTSFGGVYNVPVLSAIRSGVGKRAGPIYAPDRQH
jgi:hypothetical protein